MISSWKHLPIPIQYQNNIGNFHTYFPDFSIERNGKTIIIEVKGYSTENDFLKWEATSKLYDYEVWYREELEKLEKIWN